MSADGASISRLVGARGRLRERLDVLASPLSLPVREGHLLHLDGWRGGCILLVLAGHYSAGGLAPLSGAGVEFFFVLSGMLMADLLIFKRQQIGMFLRRRFARVFPALAVYVGLVGLAINVTLWRDGLPLQLASPLAALFYFHNYLPQHSVATVFVHTWSLAVEEHSYLLLAVIALMAHRRPMAAAAIALAIAALAIGNYYRLAQLPYDGGQFLDWRSDVRAASVLFSFGLRIIVVRFKPQLPGGIAAAAIAVLFCLFGPAFSPLGLPICTALAAYAVNALDYGSPRTRKYLANPLLVWFGTLSFSIYIWQQLFAFFAHEGSQPILCLALTVVCAVTSFKLVENPARDYLNSRWTSRRPGEADAQHFPAQGLAAAPRRTPTPFET